MLKGRIERLEQRATDTERPSLAQRLAAARARIARGEPSALPPVDDLVARGDALSLRLARARRRWANHQQGVTC